jgi:hypothetical protein
MVYINLMSGLFNKYIIKYETSIMDFVFIVPTFFNSDKFRINQSLISNPDTIIYINKHSKLEYILKIIIAGFQRQFKKEIGIINNISLNHLNDLVRKIQVKVEEQFNYNTKLDKFSYQHNLDKYPSIKWTEDSDGRVNPKIGPLFSDDENDSGKKKKKMK